MSTAIETEIWAPAERPGFTRYRSQRKFGDVQAQVEQVLKEIPIVQDDDEYNAHELMEWISASNSRPGTPSAWQEYHPGAPLVTVQRGSNEGYHIVIMARGWEKERPGDAITCFTIKFLSLSPDECWQVAGQIYKAFDLY